MAGRRVRGPPFHVAAVLLEWALVDDVLTVLLVEAENVGVDLLDLPLWRFVARAYELFARPIGTQEANRKLAEPVNPRNFDEKWEEWGTSPEDEAALRRLDALPVA